MLASGCSGRKVDQIPFAFRHAWTLLKQNRAVDAVPYTCAPELLFTRACVRRALGQTDGARELLSDAITFSIDSGSMKLRALDEPRLAAVWAIRSKTIGSRVWVAREKLNKALVVQ